jgi:hypothetical protein
MLAPPSGKEAQGVQSPEAKLTRGGEEFRMEAKTATSPPDSKTWYAHATKANDQIKSSGKRGEVSFDWTQIDVHGPGSSFPDQASIENFLSGKMTKERMRSIQYFEIVWKDVDGKIVTTSRTRAADGALGAWRRAISPMRSLRARGRDHGGGRVRRGARVARGAWSVVLAARSAIATTSRATSRSRCRSCSRSAGDGCSRAARWRGRSLRPHGLAAQQLALQWNAPATHVQQPAPYWQ